MRCLHCGIKIVKRENGNWAHKNPNNAEVKTKIRAGLSWGMKSCNHPRPSEEDIVRELV